MKRSILVSSNPTIPYTLFTYASKYAWSAMLKQKHTTATDGKTLIHQYPITYVSGLFLRSQLNWATLRKD